MSKIFANASGPDTVIIKTRGQERLTFQCIGADTLSFKGAADHDAPYSPINIEVDATTTTKELNAGQINNDNWIGLPCYDFETVEINISGDGYWLYCSTLRPEDIRANVGARVRGT